MNRTMSFLVGLVTIVEVFAAIAIGYLYRELIEMIAATLSIPIPTIWIVLIGAIPLLLILVKMHHAFRKWIGM
ncbi:MAG TPA: hypothetical protein PKV82_14935 [Anaerolineae bacterium]|nr:hypothetical protein [Anaerolineae bacterium]